MNIWAKMISALKGGEDTTEDLVDQQALRLLDNELRQATIELNQAMESVAELIATQKLADEQVQLCQRKIDEHESYARKALEQGNEALALEVAEKIVELEAQKEDEISIRDGYIKSVKASQRTIARAQRDVKRMKQQLDTLKSTQSVQRAQAAVANRHGEAGKRIQTAQDSLARLKSRQDYKTAQFEMGGSVEESEARKDDLIKKLEQAGIKTSSNQASDILARLQPKK